MVMHQESIQHWLTFDALTTLAFALLLYQGGQSLLKRVSVLRKLFIPAPILGGLTFSLIHLIIYTTTSAHIMIDTSVQIPAMSAFFACIGLSISMQKQKSLGTRALSYWLLCIFMIVIQNSLGIAMAVLFDLEPIMGVVAGSAALSGGHGLSLSIGPSLEALGITGAQSATVAAATFGLIAGALLGGPTARIIIKQNKLPVTLTPPKEIPKLLKDVQEKQEGFPAETFIQHALLISVIIGLSSALIPLLNLLLPDLTLPASVLSMFLGLLAGTLLKRKPLMDVQENILEIFQQLFLAVFLSMASLSMRLWELKVLALPLFFILLLQSLFTVIFNIYITFPLMGGDYNSSVIAAGMVGHSLGASPTAIANMEAITSRHGPAGDASLLVPLGGGFLGDLFNVPLVLLLLNILT
ncbi:MAG: hypothetical protein GX138_05450 [Firmicutes bacterium]|nr:hypothetical protein [Bacillota bacterium]